LVAVVTESVEAILNNTVPLSKLKEPLKLINKPVKQKLFNKLQLQLDWQLVENFLVLRQSNGIALIILPLVFKVLNYSVLKILIHVVILVVLSD
jgi:hypothetical protein